MIWLLTSSDYCRYLHIGAEKKWPPFSRRHFQIHFLEWKCRDFAQDFREVIAVLVQIMAWRRPSDTPLSEPVMVNLLTHIWVTRSQWVKNTGVTGPYRWGILSSCTISTMTNDRQCYILMVHEIFSAIYLSTFKHCHYWHISVSMTDIYPQTDHVSPNSIRIYKHPLKHRHRSQQKYLEFSMSSVDLYVHNM